MCLVQRDESRVDRQQFAGGQEHRNTVAPRRGEVIDDDFGSALCSKAEAEGSPRLAERQLHFASAATSLASCETAQALRAKHADELLGEPSPQQGLGGLPPVRPPAFLCAHRHDGVGELEQVGLAQPVLADDDVEAPGEAQPGVREGREVLRFE